MSPWHRLPDDWAPLPASVEQQLNFRVLLAAQVVETREVDGAREWRKK